jgi:hypothetical protein
LVLPRTDATGVRPAGSGFDATVEVSNLFGVGYVGVVARLNSTIGPIASTRNLAVRLTPVDRHLPANRSLAVTLPVTFEQGQSQASLERAFAKWTIGSSFLIEIFEDGVPLENYTSVIGSPFPGYAIQSPATLLPNETTNNVLLVDTQPRTLKNPANVVFIPPSQAYPWQSKSLRELPADWRLLRDIDCIVMDSDRMVEAASAEDEREKDSPGGPAAAIRQWVMMGGTLVLLGAADPDALGRSLRLRLVQSASEDEAFQAKVNSVWEAARGRASNYQEWMSRALTQPDDSPGLISLPFMGQENIANVPPSAVRGEFVRPTEAQLSSVRRWVADFEKLTASFEFSWGGGYRGHVGAGQIIGLRGSSIDSSLSLDLLRDLVGFQRSSMLRRGVDPMMGDGRARRWLIPGVAEPPVYTFIGILTLFVVLVGPVAYRWTTRGHRSHLMFLIAPALALLTTAAMFAYSIVADGFGTTIRVRQLTWIDGASGDAAERTRSTLFSGISPQAGLRFAAGAEVMPYPSGGRQNWGDLRSELGEVRLRVVVDESAQSFSPSLLPSRTQSQFVSHRIRRGLGVVAMEGLRPFDSGETSTGQDFVTLSSTLAFEVRDLVARSSDGRYWSTDRIGAGEAVTAKWIPKAQDSSKRLGELYIRHRLVGAVSQARRSGGGREIGDLLLYMNRQISRDIIVTDGSFERWLNDNLFVRGDLPPGTFVAVSSPSADVIAVQEAKQVESVRYVMGTLR